MFFQTQTKYILTFYSTTVFEALSSPFFFGGSCELLEVPAVVREALGGVLEEVGQSCRLLGSSWTRLGGGGVLGVKKVEDRLTEFSQPGRPQRGFADCMCAIMTFLSVRGTVAIWAQGWWDRLT